MSNISIINSIIEEKYKPINQSSLIEEDFDNNGKKFKVEYPIVKRSSSIEYVLYRFGSSDFPYFREIRGLKKMCDYILFIEQNNSLIVFVIELKLNTESAHKQLDAAKEFVEFIIKSASRIGEKITDFSLRKVRICDSKVSKKRNSSKVEDQFKFDNEGYLDYQVSRSFLIEPLLNSY